MKTPRALTFGLVLSGSVAVSAGCSRAPEEASDTQAPTSAGVLLAYVWDCDDGTSTTMDNLLAENAISLRLPEGPRRLPQVVAASGVKYDDGTLWFWTRGNSAMVQRQDGPVVNCTESRAKSLVADAQARGVTYRGLGNEPGWVLEITAPDRLVFVTNYGQERHDFAGAVESAAGSGTEYRAERDGKSLRVVVAAEPCADDMAGTQFDHSFLLEFDGRTYRGCGSRLN